METQLGRSFDAHWKKQCAAFVAYGALIADWLWISNGPSPISWPSLGVRFGFGVAGVLVLTAVARGDLGTVGLRLRPAPSWRYWLVATAIVAVLLGVVVVVTFCILYAMGQRRFEPMIPPVRFLRSLSLDSTIWPLVEEPTYRLVLCVGVLPFVGRWGAVLVAGAAFAWLHYGIYGSAQPNNMLAGFIMGWAFVRSGTILIPLLWHGLGNAAVTTIGLISWYLQNNQGT